MLLLFRMDPLKPTEPTTPIPSVPEQHLPPTPEAIDKEEVPKYTPPHTIHVSPVRSFSSDLASAIREKGGSVVRIAIAEDEKHRREREENSVSSKKNIAFILGTMLIVVGALGFLVYAFVYKQKENQPVVVQTEDTRSAGIISTEDAELVNIKEMKAADVIFKINAIVTTPNLQPGTIKDIIIVSGEGTEAARLPGNQFLNIIGSHTPDTLLRSLNPQYQIGVYNYSGSHLFLILKGSAHDYLLAGMIDWEKKLFNDMVPLFAIDTTSLSESELQSMPFRDFIIQNQDTRAVIGKDGTPLLFYSFIDPKTIVIATDSKTLGEVIRRH